MESLTFENARVIHNGARRQTVITDGLLATGEIKGMHLQQAFGSEGLANINMGYSQIFSATNRYYGKPLVGATEAKGKVKMIDRAGFRWELSGGNDQKARITQVVCTDNKPGLNKQTFDIVVDKPWFNVSDIVIPQHNERLCRVVPQPGTDSRVHRQVGPNAYRYTLQYVTDNETDYLPSRYIQLNQEWCKVSSAVATEDNVDAGGFQFYAIFESEGLI